MMAARPALRASLRRFRSTLCGAAILLACTPTEPCACPPATSLFLIYGKVQQADALPAVGAQLRATAWGSSHCGDGEGPTLVSLDPIVTAASGSFRAQLRSVTGGGLRCVRLVAYVGDPGTTDSVVAPDLFLLFRSDRETPDSLGIVMRFQ